MKALHTTLKLALGLLALALMLTASPLQADDSMPKKEKGPNKADLKKYDANGDGQLDEAEMARRDADKKALLEKYDANKNGKLDKEEKEQMKADEKAAKKAAKEAEQK